MRESLDIETRLARLEARHEISELVTRYAIACDERDLDLLASLFTKDAVFDTPNGSMRAETREGISAMFEQVLAVRGPGFHWTHDHIIRFTGDDRAAGTIFGHAETTPNGNHSLAALKYEDEYRIEDGAWRIAHRAIRFFYYVPAAGYPGALTQTDRVVLGAKRVDADIPEPLPSYAGFETRRNAARSR